MTDYYLKIELLSASISSGGEGRIGQVDREVVFDEWGLPFLPGRRLKGLWRDACRELADAWQACSTKDTKPGHLFVEPDYLFGEVGKGPGTGSARVQIQNAYLREAPLLAPWLRYGLHEKRVTRDEVIESFASVRAQTAVDRLTGAPKENTLRFTRVLRPGLTFEAPLRFAGETPEPDLLRALALGAAALQRMGVNRTRGLGEVDCRLYKAENRAKTDLTARELEALTEPLPAWKAMSPVDGQAGGTDQAASAASSNRTRPTHSAPRTADEAGGADRPVAAVSSGRASPTHFLRYTLTLEAPAVLPVLESDPNTVGTRRYLPGTCLWGAAAWAYLRQKGNTSGDPDFLRLFVEGQLRFLPAFSESRDGCRQRLLPVPHSIRKGKEDDRLVDFLEEKRPEAVRRLGEVFARIEPSLLQTQKVETLFNYHHARAEDRRKGRALGAEVEKGGAFFSYESIQAGQLFQGAVLGSEEQLRQVCSWLSAGTRVQVGRSRSAQYGGDAQLEWIDAEPEPLGEDGAEWWGFDAERGREYRSQQEELNAQERSSRLVITTLSPLLTTNPGGHPEARFPIEELRAFLDAELEPGQSYTRTELVGGYVSHLRLPRQQWPAIAPGSVFEFEVKSDSIQPDKLLELEREGMGLRRGEGFGRVAVNRHGALGLTGEEPGEIEKATQPGRPSGEALPDCVRHFLADVARRRCQERLGRLALEIADAQVVPSNSLLGRLSLILRQHAAPDNALAVVKKMQPAAQEQLEKCRISIDLDSGLKTLGKVRTLRSLLHTALQKPRDIVGELAAKEMEKILGDECAESGEQVAQIVVAKSEVLVGDFLRKTLSAMSRKGKSAPTTDPDRGAENGTQ